MGGFGVLLYIGEAICLPNGEQQKNGSYGYHGNQVVQKPMGSRGDDGYHKSGASGACRGSPGFGDQTEFGLPLDSSDSSFGRRFLVSL